MTDSELHIDTKEEVEAARTIVLAAHKLFLRGDPRGVALDVSGTDLRHANFDNVDLSYASFTKANFFMAKMDGASLGRAKLKEARLPTFLMDKEKGGPSR